MGWEGRGAAQYITKLAHLKKIGTSHWSFVDMDVGAIPCLGPRALPKSRFLFVPKGPPRPHSKSEPQVHCSVSVQETPTPLLRKNGAKHDWRRPRGTAWVTMARQKGGGGCDDKHRTRSIEGDAGPYHEAMPFAA